MRVRLFFGKWLRRDVKAWMTAPERLTDVVAPIYLSHTAFGSTKVFIPADNEQDRALRSRGVPALA